MTARGPNSESLRARVRRFFANNPGEFLTYADMQTKFGCTYQQAAVVVHDLAYRGQVESINFIRAKQPSALES